MLEASKHISSRVGREGVSKKHHHPKESPFSLGTPLIAQQRPLWRGASTRLTCTCNVFHERVHQRAPKWGRPHQKSTLQVDQCGTKSQLSKSTNAASKVASRSRRKSTNAASKVDAPSGRPRYQKLTLQVDKRGIKSRLSKSTKADKCGIKSRLSKSTKVDDPSIKIRLSKSTNAASKVDSPSPQTPSKMGARREP